MEEFLEYQQEKKAEIIEQSKEQLENCASLEELKSIWQSIPPEAKKELETLKEQIKQKYASK